MTEIQNEGKEKMKDIIIEVAQPVDAEAICNIRDDAWIDAYPNLELGITVNNIELNARGPNNKFLNNRILHLQKELSGEVKREYPIFVAKDGGSVIGFVNPEIDEEGKKTISQIYIDPKYQSKGVGSLLLKKALEALGSDYDIYLEVVSYNQKAISFYEKYGFKKTARKVERDPNKPDYLVDLPATQMVKRA